MVHADPDTLASAIRRTTGVVAQRCLACGKCSAGCPMADELKLRPHDVMRMVTRDEAARLLASEAIWLCLSCETCSTRCPAGCEPARVIDALREMALARGVRPPRAIGAFHTSFLEQIRTLGRVHEVALVTAYKLRSLDLFKDVLALPAMIERGKLSLVPRRIRGVEDVRRIMRACESEADER